MFKYLVRFKFYPDPDIDLENWIPDPVENELDPQPSKLLWLTPALLVNWAIYS